MYNYWRVRVRYYLSIFNFDISINFYKTASVLQYISGFNFYTKNNNITNVIDIIINKNSVPLNLLIYIISTKI
ncbi:hypothetical protein J18TS1_24480 [Oceanobacillus oncorhynchi subsp. incaldanensis]|nr:hypothetical protein J18TS1_24480 [Oceanobacillus oncorhynchi subsp. incaldanensis]